MTKLTIAKGIVENKVKIFDTDPAAPADMHSAGAVRNYYKITVGGRTFNSVPSLAKKIITGQQVLVILDRSEAIMICNLVTGKIYGTLGPWIVVLTSLVAAVFNLFMVPEFIADSGTRNLTMLISINALLFVVLIVSIKYFLKERKAKELLKKHLN